MDLAYPSIQAACARILDLGIEAAPEEACGILVNESLGVRVIQLRNRADNPRDSYRIDNETLRQLTLKPDTWSHVSVWHTHPGGNVGPSSGDLQSRVPGVKYVVITIPTGEVVWF